MLRQLMVTEGVAWVECPEADLRILCGCPADAVKHMIRKGLIGTRQIGGMLAETGPNAILLSDVSMQNGALANLSEFPVLQMLYRQGMLIPDHPFNTGVKPLLIGLPEQVVAQMQYIYRGNYGLASEEEIEAAGATAQQAKELVEITLYFAFGKIKNSSELLDSLLLPADESSGIEIRNGLTIKRLRPNVFEFEYEDQSTIVDLNLPRGSRYPSPTPLPFHQVPREYFGVVHSGEADGWDPDRPAMSSILMYRGALYLVDAGPNLANQLNALGISLNEIEGIFHTHCHDDHFAGLTTLMRSGRKLKYFSTSIVRTTVQKKLGALLSMDTAHFEDLFDVRDLELDEWNDIDGLEVLPYLSPHPVETNILYFQAIGPKGPKSYGHLADIAAFRVLDEMVERGIDNSIVTQAKHRYLERSDIKKIDIGGGLIHGDAKDFVSDSSKKIILAHTALELTEDEKSVGSSAPFGVVDTLIEKRIDYDARDAASYLRAYFPDVCEHYIDTLMTCERTVYSPGTLMFREGKVCSSVILILRGSAEVLSGSAAFGGEAAAGTLLNHIAALQGNRCLSTVRAVGYVTALEVPTELFCEIALRSGSMQRLLKNADVIELLAHAYLFREGLDQVILMRLADQASRQSLPANTSLSNAELRGLHLLVNGSLERSIGEQELSPLEVGDDFGGETLFTDTPQILHYRATEDAETLQLPKAAIEDIPVIRLKLLERHYRFDRGIYD